MLNAQLNWCGKLPSHADFIQSHTDAVIESVFMDWIEQGQNHVGLQFLNNRELQTLYFYVFTLKSLQPVADDTIYGLLFLSSDERGRSCPFITFTRNDEYFYQEFLHDFEKQLVMLNFDFLQLDSALDTEDIIESFRTAIESVQLQNDSLASTNASDHWRQCYPNFDLLALDVTALTPIVYRKLISR